MKTSIAFLLLVCHHLNHVHGFGIRIGSSGGIGFSGLGHGVGHSIGSGLDGLPAIRIGKSPGSNFPAIKLGKGGFVSSFDSFTQGLPVLRIGQSSGFGHMLSGFGSQGSASSPSSQRMFYPIPIAMPMPMPMPPYPRPAPRHRMPQHQPSYPMAGYNPEMSHTQNDEMDGMYKMAEEYKPDQEEEYKIENYKEMSGNKNEKPEKYKTDEYKDTSEYEVRGNPAKKYKQPKESESKLTEEDMSKYSRGGGDDEKYEDEDSKYKTEELGYERKPEYRPSEQDDYPPPPSPPQSYSSNDDFYKEAAEDYKPMREDKNEYKSSSQYPSNEDKNPYGSLTTSHKSLNSGQQDYITLVGTQFKMHPRYNSDPRSTLPLQGQQPNQQQNNYPSSIQQQIRHMNPKHSSSEHRTASNHRESRHYSRNSRDQQDNYDKPSESHKGYQKPPPQSYPVPARVQSYAAPRQHNAYPPPPAKTLQMKQFAGEMHIQQEREEDEASMPYPEKKGRQPIYEVDQKDYEKSQPRKMEKYAKRAPERYEDEYQTPKKRRRPVPDYKEEEEYEYPRPTSKKRQKSSYAVAKIPSQQIEKSVDDYMRSRPSDSSFRDDRYEAAGSSGRFSFATPSEDSRKRTSDDADQAIFTNSPSSLSLQDEQDLQGDESLSSPIADDGPKILPLAPNAEKRSDSHFLPIPVPTAVPEPHGKTNPLLPKAEVIHSLKKAIVEAMSRNQEVYDAIGASRSMRQLEELLKAYEAANYPRPYYTGTHPYNTLTAASPLQLHKAL